MINGVDGMNIELYAFRSSVRTKRISFFADALNDRGELTGIVKSMVVEGITEDDLFRDNPPPLFDMSNDMAQKLFDELYSLGFRPGEEGSKGELSATKDHLEDMRKIAFSELKKNTPIYMGIDLGKNVDEHLE
jgi:hypothetical protein